MTHSIRRLQPLSVDENREMPHTIRRQLLTRLQQRWNRIAANPALKPIMDDATIARELHTLTAETGLQLDNRTRSQLIAAVREDMHALNRLVNSVAHFNQDPPHSSNSEGA